MLSYNKLGFAHITLQIDNMRAAQDFAIYPYDGSDFLILQSDKRIIQLNVRNGWFLINSRNEPNGAKSYHLICGSNTGKLPEDAMDAIRQHLTRSAGIQGSSVLKVENKPFTL